MFKLIGCFALIKPPASMSLRFSEGLVLSSGKQSLQAYPCDAGFSTGALFRSTRGPRAAAVAGAFGLVCAAALIGARETIDTGL